jgi:Tol biopolymer transport system component
MIKKLVTLLFPLLALVGLFVALADYWWLVEIEDSLKPIDQRIDKIEKTLKIQKEKEVLGLDESIDYDTLLREYKRDNESLKQNTLKVSTTGKKRAYFQHKFTTDIKEIGDRDYTFLVVEQEGKREKVFQGDFRLSYFEWLTDEEIAVYRNCGTECMIAYIVDLKTKTPRELMLGVGYTWSPNKQYVLAYHYSSKYGISVAEKDNFYGRMRFELRREHPPSGSNLTSKTQASWSPDSNKLALVIKKKAEEKLELLLFDVKNDFRLLGQKDLKSNQFSDLGWKDGTTVFYESGGKIIEIKI